MVTIQCRDHGGTFQFQPQRGRRPVRCKPENPCSRQMDDNASQKADAYIAKEMQNSPIGQAAFKRAQATPEIVSRAVARIEAGIPRNPALPAKARLEEQGWLCTGRGWTDEDGGVGVELTAVRGDELLVMHWLDGVCTDQDYSLWSEKPSANAKPAGKLTFDPDECTDRELVRALAGCKVTWWNVLGQKEEEATIAPESMKIEHAYNGRGDETPGDRIVKFIERGGAGYRAFRVAALLKVG